MRQVVEEREVVGVDYKTVEESTQVKETKNIKGFMQIDYLKSFKFLLIQGYDNFEK